MNLAGYVRVSTEGQVDAYGKDVQRDAIQRWAELNGHKIIDFYEEDGVSGKTDGGDRPALQQLMADSSKYTAQRRIDGVVVFDATRIARRSVVQETLLSLIWATGLTVFTTTAGELSADEDDPTKILIRQILGVIAEFDHRSTVKKLHAARKIKSSQGGYIGGVTTYGIRVEGSGKTAKFMADEVELGVVELIRQSHVEGTSFRQIAAMLNRLQIPTKTGKVWDVTGAQVGRILRRYENT